MKKKTFTVQNKGNSVTIEANKKWIYIIVSVFLILCISGVAMTIWGVVQTQRAIELQKTITLQNEQIKLIDGKMKAIEKELRSLGVLDEEIRHMITGASAGAPPIGGDDFEIGDNLTPKKIDGPVSSNSILDRIFAAEKETDRLSLSLLSVKDILDNGGADEIKTMRVQYASIMRDKNSAVPELWPVQGEISSMYGARVNPATGARSFHKGVDISADYGTMIQATAAGVVTQAEYDGAYGLCVKIDHGNGFETKYAHMSDILVQPGQNLRSGDIIGLVGSTGRSTGSHVHYEVIVNGRNENPLFFMKKS